MVNLAVYGILVTLLGATLVWLGSRHRTTIILAIGWVIASLGGLALLVAFVSIATDLALGEPVR